MRRLLWATLFLVACPRTATGYASPPPDGARVTSPVTHDSCEKTPLMSAAIYESKTYYFCDDAERLRFAADPVQFADR